MLRDWLQSSLNRKLAVAMTLAMLLASVGFLFLFIVLYRAVLHDERATTTAQLSRLLQATLENAMLKRDLSGLTDVVTRLGTEPGLRSVVIANPDGEIRFAADKTRIGASLTPASLGCAACRSARDITTERQFPITLEGISAMRAVNPIRNRDPCQTCHGPTAQSPINGLLVIDSDSSAIERASLSGAALLSSAGALVVLASVMATGWVFRRSVVAPLLDLNRASRAFAENAAARVQNSSNDEVGELARSFNAMADRVEATMSELADHKAFLQAIIDALPEGVRIIDGNFRVVLVNLAYCEQAGVGPEHVGKPCYSAVGRDTPCPPTVFSCPLVELAGKPGPLKYPHTHRRADGSGLAAELTAVAVTVPRHGKPERLIIESYRDLAGQVRYSQEQRLAEIGQLATGVAHEVRNPLASVKLGLQAILRELDTGRGKTEKLERYLKLVDGEVEKCIEVTSRLLRLGMPPSERLQLLFLDHIAREVLSLLFYEAESTHVTIEFDLPASRLRVLATDSELRMLVLNIAQNALHAMPGGGALRVRGWQDADTVRLAISDTGVGIAPEILPRIFDPFFSKRADIEQGTGLGLTIAKAIVTRYHGTIEVDSTPGRGTTFTIVLPLAGHEEQA